MKDIIRRVTEDFCKEFIEDPYLCYTEHGQHALFYTKLFNAIHEDMRYISWRGNKVCIIQKEYPTAGKLGKPSRQHWDIAVIKSPPTSKKEGSRSFDYLSLDIVIEFGLNEDIEHLRDDIERISHSDSNVDFGILIHLHRLSTPGAPISGRDWSPKSKRIVKRDEIAELITGKELEVYYGLRDMTGNHETGLWLIESNGEIKKLL